MNGHEEPTDFQEVVERSYRAQWGGRRFYLATAVVLFILALICGALLPIVRQSWFTLNDGAKKGVEITALVASFICLIAAVIAAMEALLRWQREKGQIPEKAIHLALSLSVITVATLIFLLYLFADATWRDSKIVDAQHTIRRIVLLFAALVWMGSIVTDSVGITMLASRRSDMLEVNTTNEGTAVLFRKGHSTEVVKLCIAVIIPLILFITAILMVCAYLV